MGLLVIILVVLFLAACGAVMLVRDLLAGAFKYEGNEHNKDHDDGRLQDIDVGGVPGVPGIPSGGFGPSDKLRGGTKGWFANND